MISSSPNVTQIQSDSNPFVVGSITINGTANQVIITPSGQTFTFSLPQSINTGASPTFSGLTLSGLTPGSVIFAGTGGLISQDNSNFFWDSTNHRLGIRTTSPSDAFHVSFTDTSTSGTINGVRSNPTADPTSASSATVRAADFSISLGNTGTTNFTGNIQGARYLASNGRQTGTLTTLLGLQLQAINGVVFGASSGTALSTTIQAAIFQAINNSQTTSTTSEITGGQFTSEQRGTGVGAVTTLQQAGLFNVLVAGGTTTSAYGARIRTSNAFGSTLTGGTITNINLVDIEGFPSGPTYTNTPQQLLLEAGATANIAIRQQGASNHSRFQGPVTIGADATPTSTFALDLNGNLRQGGTNITFTTLTNFSFINALGQTILFMDASNTKLLQNPVTVAPTATTSGIPGPVLTSTVPANTGLTQGTEYVELLIDMSATQSWTTNGTSPITNQRALKITAPTYTFSQFDTWNEASTVWIQGPPDTTTIGQITTTAAIKIDARTLSNLNSDSYGFLIYASSGAFNSNSGGCFMAGNIGFNTLSPKTYLHIFGTGNITSAHGIVWSDSSTRYTDAYIGNDGWTTFTGSGTGILGLDALTTPSANSNNNAFALTANNTLQGSVNFTGAPRSISAIVNHQCTAGTVTAINTVISNVTSSGAGAITTARLYHGTSNLSNTGTITTMVGYDNLFTYNNVAGTATSTFGVRIGNVSKGASYTLTDFYGVRVEDQTATFGGVKVGFYQGGTNLHNRFAGNSSFGQDATPGATIDVSGKFFIDGTGGTVTKYNNVSTAGLGVPAIYSSALTGTQTANVTVLTYTPPAAAGRYVVTGVITTTSATNSGTVQFTLDYVDSQGTTHTADVIPLCNAAGTIATTQSGASKEYHAFPYYISINNSATAIVLKVVKSGTVSFTAAGTIEQVA